MPKTIAKIRHRQAAIIRNMHRQIAQLVTLDAELCELMTAAAHDANKAGLIDDETLPTVVRPNED